MHRRLEGRANAKGTCVVTDADGDEIFVEWKCSGVMPACPGTERFVGGTGAGWSDWKGEWKLP